MRSTASKIRPWSVEVTGQCSYHGKSVGFYSGIRQGGEAERRRGGETAKRDLSVSQTDSNNDIAVRFCRFPGVPTIR